jgi:glutaredoxin
MIRMRSVLLLSALAFAVSGAACKSARSDANAAAAEDAPPALPALIVNDGSEGLTFSYITTDGGFQLAKKVADVPYEARDAVRVWSEQSGDGIAGPWVYVADLRSKLGDGNYKVEVIARTQFEAMAKDRRNKKNVGPVAAKGTETAPAKDDPPAIPKGKVKVIVYGAEWCKPCHLVEAYLKKRGIPVEHKDIDEDPEAKEEMALKLDKAGIKTHSIPVIDVGPGVKLLVGYSETELESALKSAGG